MLKSVLLVLGLSSLSSALQISGNKYLNKEIKSTTFDPRNGDVAVRVLMEPKKVSLNLEEQQSNRWIKLADDSVLHRSGLTAWAPSQSGFVFKSSNNVTTQCKALNGANDDKKKALILVFHCEATSDASAARFSEKWYPSTNFWLSCPYGGVPYGWSSQWGSFSYPYYSVTPNGYMGCDSLTNGYCNSPYLYPWGSWDGYTYDNYYNTYPYATWYPGCGAPNCYYDPYTVVANTRPAPAAAPAAAEPAPAPAPAPTSAPA